MKYWVLPANSKFYRYLDAFEDLKVLDWNVSDKNGRMVGLEIGDIVFLYGSQEKRLTIKCEVIKIPVLGKDSIEDSMYGGFDKKDRIFARLKFIQNINDAGITMRDLSLMGINGNIQSARKLFKEIVDEIESRINMTSNKNNRNEYLISATSLLNSKKQIILYGPAGTGKTYNTKNIIVNHAYGDVDKIDERYKELQDQGRVQFVTFHQSFAYEDFIEGIKPNLNEEVEGNISYKVEKGIFKELCGIAEENYINSFKSIQQVNKEQELKKKFLAFLSDAIENSREFKKPRGNPFIIKEVSDDEVKIYSPDSNYSNSQVVAKLKEFYIALSYPNRGDLNSAAKYAISIFGRTTPWQVDTYIYRVLEEFDAEQNSIKVDTQHEYNELKNYYLIIDEINRGNISKIFGELITLLESSKRLGEADELTTTLPYSKEEFGIPPNLYVIGTMNTSDKSIAHLDIALRRRFGFVEMLPSYDEKIIKNEKCRILLKNLNDRIEILLDKDHLIGHSFFCGKSEADIPTIMQNEIVPLLEEYFYGDYEKIQLVLAGVGYKLEEKDIPEELKQYSSKEKLYGKLVKI
ncbi:McrB family protein [Francisella salimarina]|uniref:McrB family protein n=1 Tax=Francisella salimarina TaxID=2599927 RepID=UPI003D81A613